MHIIDRIHFEVNEAMTRPSENPLNNSEIVVLETDEINAAGTRSAVNKTV